MYLKVQKTYLCFIIEQFPCEPHKATKQSLVKWNTEKAFSEFPLWFSGNEPDKYLIVVLAPWVKDLDLALLWHRPVARI